MTLRDAAQQALEVIGWLRLHLQRDHQCLHMDSTGSGIPAWIAKAQTAICAALAEPQPEPVAIGTVGELFTNAAWERLDLRPSTKVYTNPPQRQPLTDEEIARLWSWSMTAEAERTANTQQHAFARALERAHGIGGAT